MAKQINAVLKLKDNLSPEVAKAAKKVDLSSKKMSYSMRRAGKSITRVGQSLTRHITKPALTAAAALGGVVLKKGWDRMMATDTARGKLLALGNTTEEVNKIMDDALSSVKGTAFSLDAAATTAASAVAAGIGPGKDLSSYLSSVADAAAIAGVGMSDMGRIFNKVATSNKAQMQELNQLSDKGIPIMQWLSKETGKTAAEVQKMASAGQIDLKTFRSAVEHNVGGAAKSMGGTTIKASIDNIGAAMGRIGASFLGGSDDKNSFAGQLLEQLQDLEGFLTKLEPKAKDFGAKFGAAFKVAVEKIKQAYAWFDKLSPKAKKALVAIVLGAGPAITIFGKLVTGVGTAIKTFQKIKKAVQTAKLIFSAFSLGPLAWVVLGITAAIAVGVALYKNWDTIKAKLQPLIDKFVAFKNMLVSVKEKIQGVIDKLNEMFSFDGKNLGFTVTKNTLPGVTTRVPGMASGSPYAPGGTTLVGERGPELVNLPRGSKVIPNGRTRNMLSDGNGVTVNVNISGNVIGNESYANELGTIISGKLIAAMGNI